MARLRRVEPEAVPGVWLLDALRTHRGPLGRSAARMLDDLEAHVLAQPVGPERTALLARITETRGRQ